LLSELNVSLEAHACKCNSLETFSPLITQKYNGEIQAIFFSKS